MIKKIALVLAILVIAGYFGLKYYVERSVATGLDDVIRSMSSVARIRYASVTSTMGGKLTIDDLSIQPKGMDGVITIDGAGIALPSFRDLMSLDDITPAWLYEEGVPEWVEVFVDGIRIDPQADYFVALDEVPVDATAAAIAADPIGDCLLDYASAQVSLDALGYDTLDISFAYTFRQLEKTYAMDFRYSATDMLQVHGTMELDGRASKIVRTPNYKPALVAMTLEFNDQSIGERFYERCAKLGVDRATADAAGKARMWAGVAAAGFIPDERLLEQMAIAATEQHKNIRLTLNPSSPVDLTKTQFYKPEDMPALLGVDVTSW